MTARWKDVTSFSQGDTTREPRSWELTAGEFRISVTRRVGLDGWFLMCPALGWRERRLLDNVEAAKQQAREMLARELLRALKALGEQP